MLFLMLFYDDVIKMNVLNVIFLRHNDQIKLWIFWTQSSNGKQVMTQDLEERYEICQNHRSWSNVIPAESSFTRNHMKGFPVGRSMPLNRKWAQPQAAASSICTQYLSTSVLQLSLFDPLTKFNRPQLNICTQSYLRCVCCVAPLIY